MMSKPAHLMFSVALVTAMADAGTATHPSNGDRRFPDLPQPIASFGAAVHDGYLYVVGGHIGREHQHSRDNFSTTFQRLKIDGGKQWETLPGEFPLQSVALVSNGKYLYRIGGMTAKNARGEKEDLYSTDGVDRFDPAIREWTTLPTLPEKRSSHDAVIVDNKLYILGGWNLNGSTEWGRWPTTGFVMDLDKPDAWRTINDIPFRRRAVAVAGDRDKLYVLGGIERSGDMSQRVDVYDLASKKWNVGPELPSNGFGMSAFTIDGRLYASGMNGDVYRLAKDGKSWETLATLQHKRIFHRLLPLTPREIVFIAGANRKDGHLANIETLRIDLLPASAQASAQE